MKAICTTLTLCLSLLAVRSGLGQASPQADKLYLEAIEMDLKEQHADALARMQKAVALAPKHARYREYHDELGQLVAREKLYEHALKAPAEVETTPAKLAAYLVKPAQSSEDKVRLIYRWVADRIAYDLPGLHGKTEVDSSIAGVLKSRKAVCAGYSRLFEALAKEAGLEVVSVSGNAASYGIGPHAWNAVKLNGSWRLLDTTWGAGSTDANGFTKKFDEYYLFPPHEQLIFTHLPDDAKWQLVPKPVTETQFRAFPEISSELFEYGFKAGDLRTLLEKKPKRLVQAFPLTKSGPRIRLLEAPLDGTLQAGQKYRFRVDAPGFDALWIFNGNIRPIKSTPVDGVYDVEVTPQKGDLALNGAWLNDRGKLSTVVRYVVE
jgi:hypothetical protein